jgi:glycosyltransferase involved in cell wall biosynthesis
VHSPLSEREASALLGLAPDKTTYLAFGRIRPYKELDRLLNAFSVHHATHPDTQLLVAGQVDTFPGSKELARRCAEQPGVVARLEQVPNREVPLLFAASDLTIIAYRNVLNSGVAIESIAHGCPVVAPRVGGLPEVLEGGGGLLFEPDDDLALTLDAAYALAHEPGVRVRARALGDGRTAVAMSERFTAVVEDLMR